MLDQHDRQPALAVEFFQNRDHPVSLGRAQPCHHLIEQKQFRIGGERARYFQPLAIGQRQCRRALRALVVEIEPPQNVVRHAPAASGDRCPMQQRPNDHVVFDSECRKRPHDLKGAADATPAYLVGRQPVDPLACKIDGATVRRETPAIMLNSVVLPAPFGPITAKMPPCGPQN